MLCDMMGENVLFGGEKAKNKQQKKNDIKYIVYGRHRMYFISGFT